MTSKAPAAKSLLVLGGIELALLGLLGWWPGLVVPLPGFVLFGAAFVVYLLAWTNRPVRGQVQDDRIIWGVAILCRLVLLPLTPDLSDDFYRYLWDGHVQLQGINPYLYPPSDSALEAIRTTWHSLINHPEVSTIYPPLTQAAFFVVATLGGSVLVLKLFWVLLDLATAFVLAKVAKALGRDHRAVLLLYLWSPLLIVETAWNGHLEPLGLLPLALVLLLDAGHSPKARSAGVGIWVGITLGLSALAKIAPAAALPPLVRRWRLHLALAFVSIVVAFYLPFVQAGDSLWSGLSTYSEIWRFNDGPYWVLDQVFSAERQPRIAAGVIVLGVIAWATYRSMDAERALFWILGAGLMLSPTVHPWYVLWILPFVALRQNVPWLLLSGLVFLAYFGLAPYRNTGVWPHPLWLRLVIWGPTCGLLLWRIFRPKPPSLEQALGT